MAVDEAEKIRAISNGAAALVTFMQTHYKQFDVADCKTISDIQHDLMDHVIGKTPLTAAEVEAKVKVLIKEMYVLEKKYQ